jgi:hypothetical protein
VYKCLQHWLRSSFFARANSQKEHEGLRLSELSRHPPHTQNGAGRGCVGAARWCGRADTLLLVAGADVKKWIAANKGVIKMSLVKSKGKHCGGFVRTLFAKRARCAEKGLGALWTSMATSSPCRFATRSGHLSLTTRWSVVCALSGVLFRRFNGGCRCA